MKICSDSDLRNIIKVQFEGEPTVDKDGPKNEFYSLLHNEMSKSSLFIGELVKKSFNHNILALEERDYYIYMGNCAPWESWKVHLLLAFLLLQQQTK